MKFLLLAFAIIFGIGVTVVMLWAGIFYWKNLRGIWPALNKPSEDIVELLSAKQTPFTVPQGFSISVFAENLRKPRVLAVDPSSTRITSTCG